MKKLSDYTGKEAIELWADLFEPMSKLLSNKNIKKKMSDKKTTFQGIAMLAMKECPDLLFEIVSRIDNEEINGANIMAKVVILFAELMNGDKATAFFKSAEPEVSGEKSSGSATENTEGGSK